jgi:uncharacterized membrane protein
MSGSRTWRLIRHLVETPAALRRRFPPAALERIQAAVAAAEARHSGEIRVALETDLHMRAILAGHTARDRALEVFGGLRVWDTSENNGVLIYLLFADHSVEIIADRGFNELVRPEEWQAVCRKMEGDFRAGLWDEGMIHGVEAVGVLIARHFPGAGQRNELPDRPVIL